MHANPECIRFRFPVPLHASSSSTNPKLIHKTGTEPPLFTYIFTIYIYPFYIHIQCIYIIFIVFFTLIYFHIFSMC